MHMEYTIPIFATFLIINLGVGLYYGRNVKTLREYAIGNKNFSTFAIAVTIAATYITGTGLVTMTIVKGGWIAITSRLSNVLTLALLGILYIRAGEFLNHLTLAESMGSLYGKGVRIIVAISGIFASIGIIATQFQVGAVVLGELLGTKDYDAIFMTILAGIIVLIYSTFGGIRSIVFTDLLQFLAVVVFIPLLVVKVWDSISPTSSIIPSLKKALPISMKGPAKFGKFITKQLPFSFLAFLPFMFQRMQASKNVHQARRSFLYATAISFLVVSFLVCLALLLKVKHPGIPKKAELLQWLYKQHGDNTLFKGLMLVGVWAMVMSTADSCMNAASVLLVHDLWPSSDAKKRKPMLFVRFATVFIGTASIAIALSPYSILDIWKPSRVLYTSVIIVPLLLTLLGFRSTKGPILIGMLAGLIIATLSFYSPLTPKLYRVGLRNAEQGMIANLICLLVSHYFFKTPGGWVGIKNKAPLIAEKQARKRKYSQFQKAVKNFNLKQYLNNNLPKREHTYVLVGFYVLIFMFSSWFFLPSKQPQANFLLPSFLSWNAFIATYPIWPKVLKKNNLVAPIWVLGVAYIFFYTSISLVLLSGFSTVYLVILVTNLILAALLLNWNLFIPLLLLSIIMVGATCHLGEISVTYRPQSVTTKQVVYISCLVTTLLFTIFKNKHIKHRLEKHHTTLSSLQKSAEEALYQMKSAPDYFAKQIIQTKTAGIQSAYTLSQALQEKLKDTTISQEIQKTATQLNQQIEKSAQYLEKTIHLIETQMQLQKNTLPLKQFLDQLYDELPGLEEGALLLDNQSKANTIQCDVAKMHRLLRKVYEQIRLEKTDQDYFYLHVQDTLLRYPNHTKPIPALAFLLTDSEQTTPRIAASYTHLDKIPIDPHLAGNRFLKEAQIMVDKHYGYLDFTYMPDRYLIVLPTRLDDIRPQIIEDQQVPSRSLNRELLREAKLIEADFWNAIAQKPHYDILEIEKAVSFMKATHQHQTRKSGHPYYTHTLNVAKYASEHSKEPYIVIAALLHDIVEDTGMGLEEIGVRFGSKVEKLVKLLSNIKGAFKKYKLDSKKEQVALLASDKEAILIKACDRLHNLQTLGAMPRHKQKAKAEETLEYYTPVIRAAGFEKLAEQLEEIAKKFLP